MLHLLLKLLFNIGNIILSIIVLKFYIIDHLNELDVEEVHDRMFNFVSIEIGMYSLIGTVVLLLRR